VNRALEQQVRFAAIATTPSVLCWLVPNLTGRSAVSISSRANDAFGLHCRQETDGSLRRLESCVLHRGRFRRPLRLGDAILEFGFLHSSILESGHADILELVCRQVNRCRAEVPMPSKLGIAFSGMMVGGVAFLIAGTSSAWAVFNRRMFDLAAGA
jgi:hypothetical protein